MIDQGHLPSIIFWGPPGVGKTTIALLLAQAVDRPFISLSALNTGVKELREVIAESGDLLHALWCLLTKFTVLINRSRMPYWVRWKR